jgi:hypothetical protein
MFPTLARLCVTAVASAARRNGSCRPRYAWHRCGSIWRVSRIRRWAWCAAAAPLLLSGVSFAVMAVLNETANPSPALDVTANWMLVMVFSVIFWFPATVATWAGAAGITDLPWGGRIVATIALAWNSALWLFALTETARTTFDPQSYDEFSWAATLTPGELAVFAAPFVGMIILNGCAIWVVWRRHHQHPDTPTEVSTTGSTS